MFSMHNFVMKMLKGMIGNEPDYKVLSKALAWAEKDVLTEDDLAIIYSLIEEKNAILEDVFTDESAED